MGFEGKTVLVTGAANGIGAAIARGFAAEGATTFGLDVAWPSDATTGNGVTDDGMTDDGIRPVHCDLTDDTALRDVVADIERTQGSIEVLINNAALSGDVEPKPFDQISHEEWTRILLNNTLAPFNSAKAVVPGMRARQYGRIVNLSSGTAFTGVPNALAYVSSKGAIVTMTRALAKELGEDNITVNSVAPGLTATERMRANPGWPQGVWDRSIQNRSIKRQETADDLVGACLFFAGDSAAFVSGQTLIVDGGYIFN